MTAFYFMEANPAAISTLDVSNLNHMGFMFGYCSFNQDISAWDTSNVKDMEGMFSNSPDFNSDISGWNTFNVINMNSMFARATSFNQDLSKWCVSNFSEMPGGFDMGSGFEGDTAKQPQWGTCPSGENIALPEI